MKLQTTKLPKVEEDTENRTLYNKESEKSMQFPDISQ